MVWVPLVEADITPVDCEEFCANDWVEFEDEEIKLIEVLSDEVCEKPPAGEEVDEV